MRSKVWSLGMSNRGAPTKLRGKLKELTSGSKLVLVRVFNVVFGIKHQLPLEDATHLDQVPWVITAVKAMVLWYEIPLTEV